jgi:cytochrome c oxidase cbb3-type subunit III
MQLENCTPAIAAILIFGLAQAQAQPQAQANRPQIEIANPNATFPAQQRALAPAEVIERGDGLYQVNCMGCHGADLRGGDQGGPNLLRSTVVLNDVDGELIGEIVRSGMNRMPPITTLDDAGIRAVAGYIHSVLARAQGQGAPPRVEYNLDIVVGNVRRGERFFNEQCTECHSVTRDLRGLAGEIEDPVDLQNTWVAGRRQGRFGRGAVVPKTVTVTTAEGREIGGELLRYDDFFVALRTPTGDYRSFSRIGGQVDVEIFDPLWRHAELWSELDDDTIHDVTAYLETLR